MSANRGFPEAQFCFGRSLALGDGVQKDIARAAYYFKLAADQGHPEAQFGYAGCIWSDLEKAGGDLSLPAHYLKLSADQNFSDAQFEYACCLQQGIGVAMNK
jgi:TPR repeat protein